jgi:hypothetical protein
MVGAKMIGRITAAYTEFERITRVTHGPARQ